MGLLCAYKTGLNQRALIFPMRRAREKTAEKEEGMYLNGINCTEKYM